MTAEEFYNTYSDKIDSTQKIYGLLDPYQVKELMIEFAKYHVHEALKEALDEVPFGGSDEVRYDDVKGILTCYPLENIK